MEVLTKTFLGGITMGMIKDKFIKNPEPTTPAGRSIEALNMGIGKTYEQAAVVDNIKEDMVNHPKHYKIEGISEEVIDICEAMIKDITKETGNPVLASHIAIVIQYVMRAHKKNGKEDYKKAIWYLNRAIASMKGE